MDEPSPTSERDGGAVGAPASEPESEPGFRRALGSFDATMVVVGGIIGAGIFINPYIVAQRLDSGRLVLAAWAAGGAVALAGAMSFAELGSLFPRVGGQYAYLRDAFHPLAGFLYGWALLLMIETGAIAAVAITFAEYTLRFAGAASTGSTALAVAAIVVVSVVNYLGVVPGSRLLNVFVVLKVLALVILIVAGLMIAGAGADGTVGAAADAAATDAAVTDAAATDAAATDAAATDAGATDGPVTSGVAERSQSAERSAPVPWLLLAFGGALIPVMFSYGGWQNANYIAEEIDNPRKNLPLSVIGGTLIVVVVYLLVNLVYLRALDHGGLAATLTPAADTARAIIGETGDRLIALAIAISTFGFLDLTVLAPTRVYYAMANDRVFFTGVARLHPRFRTPSLAIVIQSTWAIALTLTGTYAQLVEYVVFADWIFFGLTVATVFVFRRRLPLAERPPGTFATPGYPWLPAMFVAVAVLIVLSVLRSNPVGSAIGVVLLLAGLPAFWWWSRSG